MIYWNTFPAERVADLDRVGLLDFMRHCRVQAIQCATRFGESYHEMRFNRAARELQSRGYTAPLMNEECTP